MKYYLQVSINTGNSYIHTDKEVFGFVCVKEFDTKAQAVEYYRMVVNSNLDELMELTEGRRDYA